MRKLIPDPATEVDLFETYRIDAGAALLRLNMVSSVDGRVTDRDGRSGGLGSDGDKEVFRTLRALADGILVGAGTARAEDYGPHRLRTDLAQRRTAVGLGGPAPIVVVSRSLDMDYDAPLFSEALTPTIMLTCQSAPVDAQRRAAEAGVVVLAGDTDVDLKLGIAVLRQQFGLAHILCEGGPSLNGALLRDGLGDELCMTIAPLLVGTPGLGLLDGALPEVAPLSLLHALEQDAELFLRYRVDRRVGKTVEPQTSSEHR